MFQATCYSKKQQENQFVNSIITNHDLCCGCNNPAYHSLYILTKKLAPELKEQEKNQLKKCLGEEHTTAADGVEGDLTFGDLDKLFEEDFTEDADG
uniref:Hepatitis TT virus Orf2/Gyrovirus Vp2 N-terminal domain-containing protein n=1 Tax=TTV-like mini virus TaxID=93678 RepID=A0A7L8Y9X4_9VIRU|nr:hypothetical protein [TTV-like mini virus]